LRLGNRDRKRVREMDYQTAVWMNRMTKEGKDEAEKVAKGLSTDALSEFILREDRELRPMEEEAYKRRGRLDELRHILKDRMGQDISFQMRQTELQLRLPFALPPLYSAVTYRGRILSGRTAIIEGKVGKLIAVAREYAQVSYEDGGVWIIPLMDIEPVPEEVQDSQQEKSKI